MGQEGGWVGAEGADTTRPRLCTKVGGWSKRMGGRGKGADAIRPQGSAPVMVGGLRAGWERGRSPKGGR